VSKSKTTGTVASAAVISCCVAFTPQWEGYAPVAQRDMIGTGHPITYCYGQTPVDGGAVKVGQRFTREQCDAKLAESLPKYLAEIEPCIHVPLPDKTKASLLDAAYNAGSGRVCHSPMLAKMNAGDLVGGCNAFQGWIVRSDGRVRAGLVARRSGVGTRKSEKQLCLEGVKEGLPKIETPDVPKVGPYHHLTWWERLIVWVSSFFGH
jgi:lysozyme